MAWLFLAPHPLPFGISVQREMGFVGHIGIFAMVTLACAVTFPRALWRVAAVLLVAAVCLEAAQLFIPTRGAEFADVAMNCVGILLGLVAFVLGLCCSLAHTRKNGSDMKIDPRSNGLSRAYQLLLIHTPMRIDHDSL